VGLKTNPDLPKQVTQLIWRQVLEFMWQRFNKYKNQKKDTTQWHFDGQRLYKMAITLARSFSPLKEGLLCLPVQG
jgi:hypothetical protein